MEQKNSFPPFCLLPLHSYAKCTHNILSEAKVYNKKEITNVFKCYHKKNLIKMSSSSLAISSQ